MLPKYIEHSKHRMKIRQRLLPLLLLPNELLSREALQPSCRYLIRQFLTIAVNWHCLKIILLFFLMLNLNSLTAQGENLAKLVKELVSHIQHRLNCKAVHFFVFLCLVKKAEA